MRYVSLENSSENEKEKLIRPFLQIVCFTNGQAQSVGGVNKNKNRKYISRNLKTNFKVHLTQ